MFSSLKMQFSLTAADAEARADERIFRRALEVFVERETMNSYLAQFVFAIIALAGYLLHAPLIMAIGLFHVAVDGWGRLHLGRLSRALAAGAPDLRELRRIELIFYIVGLSWATPVWAMAEGLDGLRLLLTVVAVAGILIMANTTCFAPRVFRSTVIGFALGVLFATATVKTIPWYVLGSASAAFLVVAVGVGVGGARQLIATLKMQVERDEAIDGQKHTIAALDLARKAATHLAETDDLTGLANRYLFLQRLDGLIEAGQDFVLIFLDVDFFKNINDALGHNVGDEVLRAVGGALGEFGREFGFAARLGGDEFALIIEPRAVPVSHVAILRDVKTRIEGLREADTNLPAISITAGSARFPDDARDRSSLLAAADMAQREAKKMRRGGHLDYSFDLSEAFHRETRIGRAIHEALAARALFLCFQPKINLISGAVDGAEALSRFSAPEMAGFPLDEVFEVAENRGLAALLDELVLDRYREALVSLRDAHGIDLPTSVNLSGAILKTPERLLAKLEQLIDAGLSPARIRVEITENAIYGRGQLGVVKLLNQIAEAGFSLALDDFGTGSGALRHLASLPVSEIKIDRSFVSAMRRDRKSHAIVHGLIVTGREMGIDIVAEGVETEDEAQRLRKMGARCAQGFLWSKALPLGAFVDFVRQFGATAPDDKPKRLRQRA